MAQLGNDGVDDVVEVEQRAAGQGNAGNGRLQWSTVMSSFVLRRFADLVAEGVKTDKGFKEVHLHAVAKDLSEFTQQIISPTQVYNHLRKWRSRWVKICRLRNLSAALWDDDNCMITLDPEHYNGHVKDHPKDAEFLNAPLLNYPQMEAIFAGGVATGRYAMGSNEALGKPGEQDAIDLDADSPRLAHETNEEINDTKRKGDINDIKGKGEEQKVKKQKRTFSSEDSDLMIGMTDAIRGFAAAVSESNHCEAAPGIYEAVMGCPNFTKTELIFCLNHLMQNKATALVFVGMSAEDKDLWLRTYLGSQN